MRALLAPGDPEVESWQASAAHEPRTLRRSEDWRASSTVDRRPSPHDSSAASACHCLASGGLERGQQAIKEALDAIKNSVGKGHEFALIVVGELVE